MSWFLGIDIGSKTSKGVLLNDGLLTARYLLISGTNYNITVTKLKDELLKITGVLEKDISYTVTTGHAESLTYGNEYVTDIRCCARGIHQIFPQTRAVIDIQGQNSQYILVNPHGQVINFVISEKCAGGSGRFLDIVANVLRVNIEDVGELSLKSLKPVAFTTGCAVFGESEAISRVAEGMAKEDILAGVHQAVAEKISALVSRIGLKEPCSISGGGALNPGLIKSLAERLKIRLLIPNDPQFVNALGAAVIAQEQFQKLAAG